VAGQPRSPDSVAVLLVRAYWCYLCMYVMLVDLNIMSAIANKRCVYMYAWSHRGRTGRVLCLALFAREPLGVTNLSPNPRRGPGCYLPLPAVAGSAGPTCITFPCYLSSHGQNRSRGVGRTETSLRWNSFSRWTGMLPQRVAFGVESFSRAVP